MKRFECGNCGGKVFFENSTCLKCGTCLGFVSTELKVGAFQPAAADGSLQRIDGPGAFRRCGNFQTPGACSWMLPAEAADPFCLSCRLNQVIPDLSKPGNPEAWLKLETAKRRLIYSLLSLGLPVVPKADQPVGGLAFAFLEDTPPGVPGEEHVFTGHEDGLITINLDETDDPKRELARKMMGEMYRTVLGHFRHEVGHYYWDLLVKDGPHLEEFRQVFGDDRADYATALANHYAQGQRPDWQLEHVSVYAASHPWEDWAETWAHYLHILDTLETAAAEGLVVRREGGETVVGSPFGLPFGEIARQWSSVSLLLNALNRSMGLADPYPFILADTVIRKLTLIHDWIAQGVAQAAPAPPPPPVAAAQ